VSTTGVHKSEKKGVCGQPVVEARARARGGSRSRWGSTGKAGRSGKLWDASKKKRKHVDCLLFLNLVSFTDLTICLAWGRKARSVEGLKFGRRIEVRSKHILYADCFRAAARAAL
jgi:hypothetical protein